MSKIFFIAARAVMSGMIACLFVTPTWSNKVLTSVDKEDLKERIENLSSPIDLRYSAEVHHIVDSYIRHARKSSERLLGLSEQYFPVYEHILSDQGIPTELKYLSVVESGLRPTIESHVGAVGMWQFMSGTAKFYGLTVNSTVDERRDVIRSTEAASIYLRDLYHQFGDWTLAIAAYNCGPGKLKRVLRRYPNQEFWHVRGGLPKETRRYVPKYVAMSYMMSYWHIHGLTPVAAENASKTASVRVHNYTKLSAVARTAGMSVADVWSYNPAFLKGYIPKSTKGYMLTLPEEHMYQYLAAEGGWENLLTTPTLSSNLKDQYYVRSGLKSAWAEIVTLERPHNQVLSVKPLMTSDAPLPQLPIQMVVPEQTGHYRAHGRKYHRLRSQQSLIDVAKLHGMTLRELVDLNQIDIQSPPAAGTVIRVE